MSHNDCYPSLERLKAEPQFTAYLVEANNRYQMGPAWYLIDKATERQIASFAGYTPACQYIQKHHIRRASLSDSTEGR